MKITGPMLPYAAPKPFNDIPSGIPFSGVIEWASPVGSSRGYFVRLNTSPGECMDLKTGGVYVRITQVREYHQYDDHELILRG